MLTGSTVGRGDTGILERSGHLPNLPIFTNLAYCNSLLTSLAGSKTSSCPFFLYIENRVFFFPPEETM